MIQATPQHNPSYDVFQQLSCLQPIAAGAVAVLDAVGVWLPSYSIVPAASKPSSDTLFFDFRG
eukprot:scaffold5303_cov97-Skeletonema_dohrnii-CCMP3373.AAC.7